MKWERDCRTDGSQADGQPFGGGINGPQARPPEHPRTEHAAPSQPIEIVDLGRLERRRAQKREGQRRYMERIKQAAVSGDEEARQILARIRERNRGSQRRWRQRHRAEHARQVIEYRRHTAEAREKHAARERARYHRKK